MNQHENLALGSCSDGSTIETQEIVIALHGLINIFSEKDLHKSFNNITQYCAFLHVIEECVMLLSQNLLKQRALHDPRIFN